MVVALAAALVLALVDWVGVVRGATNLRWVGKPGVMVALIVAAVLAPDAPGAVQAWFVVALVLSLIGDVALLLPERWFLAGLAAFLLAHLAYIAGMVQLPLALHWGVLTVLGGVVAVGPVVVRSVRAGAPALLVPVTAYLIVISSMAVVAWYTGEPWLILAAMLFFASDAMLGWGRFVSPTRARTLDRRVAALAVMVTYHGAQACFVLWLVTR